MLLVLAPSNALYVCANMRSSVPYSVLQLRNQHDGNVAFKVKLKVPKAYIVRPTSGTLGPHESQDLHIIPTPEDVGVHTYNDIMLVRAIAVGTLDPISPSQWSQISMKDIEEHKLTLTEELQFASTEIRNDREVVLHSVEKHGMSLEFSSQELRNDREVVLCAVEEEGMALQFASEELRNDKEVVMRAVEERGQALQFASKEIRCNPDVILAAIAHGGLDLDNDTAPMEAKALRDCTAKNKHERMFQLTLVFLEKVFVLEKAKPKAEEAYANECLILARQYLMEQTNQLTVVEPELECHLKWDILTRCIMNFFETDEGGHLWAAAVAACMEKQEIEVAQDQVNEGHTFFFVNADRIRQHNPEEEIPRYQELDKSWLNIFYIPHTDAQNVGRFASKEFLLISHRWEEQGKPDPRGIQLRAIQVYLSNHSEVKWIWYDYWCMPQGTNMTVEETMFFTVSTAHIAWLYLTVPVLIVYDLLYMGRFWTSFESFLAMHEVTPYGLKSTMHRHEVITVGAARHSQDGPTQMLRNTWASKTWVEAVAILQDHDFDVTMENDKAAQFGHMRKLIDQVSSELVEVETPETSMLPEPAKDGEALQKLVKGAFVNGLDNHRRMLSHEEFHAIMKNIDPKLEGEFLDRVFLRLSSLDYEKLIEWIFQ